jgi:hypothetical protein
MGSCISIADEDRTQHISSKTKKHEDKPIKRESLPIAIWTNNMLAFMRTLVRQFKQYDINNHTLVIERFRRFESGNGLPSRTCDDVCHQNAVQELSRLLNCVALESLSLQIAFLVNEYADMGRTKDFEEIAFIFAIVVNEPNLRMYEICS